MKGLKPMDLTGQKFSRLTVVRLSDEPTKWSRKWVCQCECGNVISAFQADLRRGHPQSCGCAPRKTRRGHRLGTLQERFDLSCIPEPMSGCWLWTKGLDRTGYAKIRIAGTRRMMSGHRLSWQLHRSPIPVGLHVLHRCDQPSCVNPEHLFLGTHQENMADMARKGRANNGPAIRASAAGRTK